MVDPIVIVGELVLPVRWHFRSLLCNSACVTFLHAVPSSPETIVLQLEGVSTYMMRVIPIIFRLHISTVIIWFVSTQLAALVVLCVMVFCMSTQDFYWCIIKCG